MLGERRAQERLAGVRDADAVRRERFGEAVHLQIEHVEVDDEQRRAVHCGELARGHAAERLVDGARSRAARGVHDRFVRHRAYNPCSLM